MGENIVRGMGENFVKSMDENFVKVWVKKIGEKSMGKNLVKKYG